MSVPPVLAPKIPSVQRRREQPSAFRSASPRNVQKIGGQHMLEHMIEHVIEHVEGY